MPKTQRPKAQASRDVLALLADLERGGALSSFQARRLLAGWPTPRDDWASSPYFRNVGEHSRAYIDQLRASKGTCCEGVLSSSRDIHLDSSNDNHHKELIVHVPQV
jgi:hypothetical protein